jgi:hypothetical protein
MPLRPLWCSHGRSGGVAGVQEPTLAQLAMERSALAIVPQA